jgi:hypothetical protein
MSTEEQVEYAMFPSDFKDWMYLAAKPTTPIFIPSKHTKMSYAKQNRIAKAKRNNKQKHK